MKPAQGKQRQLEWMVLDMDDLQDRPFSKTVHFDSEPFNLDIIGEFPNHNGFVTIYKIK